MTWPMIKSLLDSQDSRAFRNLVKNADFWTSDERIFLWTATALREKGCCDEAAMLVDQALRRRSDISHKGATLLQHVQAECLLDRRHFREAVAVYKSILVNVEDPIAYANRGLAYWELGKYKNARQDYSKAVLLDPTNVIVNRSLGELLNKAGEFRKAVKYLKKAVKLKPDCSRSLCALGVSYYNTNEWLKAYRALKQAIKIDPNNEVAKLGLKKLERHFQL